MAAVSMFKATPGRVGCKHLASAYSDRVHIVSEFSENSAMWGLPYLFDGGGSPYGREGVSPNTCQ